MKPQPIQLLKLLLIAAISTCTSLQVSAQEDTLPQELLNLVTNNIFLSEIPNTWIAKPLWHSRPFNFMADRTKKVNPYIFKADINPYFNFFSSPKSSFAAYAVARVKIRNFNSEPQRFTFSLDSTNNSLPVRTPSFMPAVNLYWAPYSFNIGENNVYKRTPSNSAKTPFYRRRQIFFKLTLEHHSNGQDGDEYDSVAVPTFDNPDRIFNVTNGTFGKNLYGILFAGFSTITKFDRSPLGNLNFLIRRPLDSTNILTSSGKERAFWRKNIGTNFTTINSIQLGLEHQFLKYSPGLALYYPKNFLHAKFNHSMFNIGQNDESSEIQRFTIYAMFGMNDVLLFDNSDFFRRLNIEFQYNWKIPFSPSGNIFINGGYKGWDDYNIYFEDNYWFFNIGFSVFNAGFRFK